MIAELGFTVRWIHLVSCVGVGGACVLLVLAGRSDRPTATRWQEHVLRVAQALVLLAIASGIGALATQAALLESRAGAAVDPSALARLALQTQAGGVWLVRHGLLLLLAAFLVLRASLLGRADWITVRGETALLGLAALGLLAASGHAAAVEPNTVRAIAVDTVHLLATGVWLGGLAPLALLLRAASDERGADARPYAVLAVRRFSRCALAAVMVLVVTGVGNGLAHVGDVAGLVGTPYGRLLLLKLALLIPLLAVASRSRRLLPELSGEGGTIGRPAMRRLARFVAVELALALGVLAVVVALTVTPPARHQQPTWPFPWRLSFITLADAPALRVRVLVGSQVALFGAVAILCGLMLRRLRAPLFAGAIVLLVVGAGLALPPLAIDAYPATYVRPAAPYTAASIAAGAELYARHCAGCHGRTGGGDGPASLGLPRPPADLRAPHTAHHTAGDLFWWVSYGISGSGMPGFASALNDEERWDLVNFVRALAAADQARRLGPVVEPERPRVVAPDAGFAVGPAFVRALRDYRGGRVVLLALYTLPGSRPRLAALAEKYDTLLALGAEVVAVPRDAAPDAIKRLGADLRVFFPVVTEGGADIVRAYDLFSRRSHAEFLIDRQGYLRAIVAGDPAPPDVNALLAEVQQLNQEKTVAPPASEHVH